MDTRWRAIKNTILCRAEYSFHPIAIPDQKRLSRASRANHPILTTRFKIMQKRRRPLGWCAVFTLWVFGALLLRHIWNYQKSLPDPLGSYIEFTIMFLVTFYVLALLPIKSCVDWFLRRYGLPSAVNQDFET
jgi:hypothetical protein